MANSNDKNRLNYGASNYKPDSGRGSVSFGRVGDSVRDLSGRSYGSGVGATVSIPMKSKSKAKGGAIKKSGCEVKAYGDMIKKAAGGKVQTSSDTARKLATEMGGMKKGGIQKKAVGGMPPSAKTIADTLRGKAKPVVQATDPRRPMPTPKPKTVNVTQSTNPVRPKPKSPLDFNADTYSAGPKAQATDPRVERARELRTAQTTRTPKDPRMMAKGGVQKKADGGMTTPKPQDIFVTGWPTPQMPKQPKLETPPKLVTPPPPNYPKYVDPYMGPGSKYYSEMQARERAIKEKALNERMASFKDRIKAEQAPLNARMAAFKDRVGVKQPVKQAVEPGEIIVTATKPPKPPTQIQYKNGGKASKLAKGGAGKVRKGMMSPQGSILQAVKPKKGGM